jgi:hypothetical protein
LAVVITRLGVKNKAGQNRWATDADVKRQVRARLRQPIAAIAARAVYRSRQ